MISFSLYRVGDGNAVENDQSVVRRMTMFRINITYFVVTSTQLPTSELEIKLFNLVIFLKFLLSSVHVNQPSAACLNQFDSKKCNLIAERRILFCLHGLSEAKIMHKTVNDAMNHWSMLEIFQQSHLKN